MTGAPEVLAGGAVLGDRFVARLGVPTGPGWLEVPELFGPTALAAAASAFGTTSPAVGATLLFERYAQRLVAPVLAALHRDGTLLDARPARIRALLEGGVLRRLAFAGAPEPLSGPGENAVLHRLVAGNLDPVADTLHRRAGAGRRVLRGAMANAVASALLHLSWPRADRAAHVDDALAWLDRVPGWAGLVEVRAERVGGEPWMYVRRRSCCLAFRTTVNQSREQPYCSSCPVLAPSTTAALFERATTAYAAGHPR